MIRFASLGSGSEGNGLVVEVGATRVLLDCGFNVSGTTARLARLGLTPDDLDALVVTHEHSDHLGGVARFAARHRIRVHMTFGTAKHVDTAVLPDELLACFDSHEAFAIADLAVYPFPVPHDATEPAQFVFSDGSVRLGVLTDIGHITAHVAETLSGLDALVLECNHDGDMLARGPYPEFLKARVGGRFGHLSNTQAAELMTRIDRSRLRHVIAAHLSKQNNSPELARAALAAALGCAHEWIGVADQASGFSWRQV